MSQLSCETIEEGNEVLYGLDHVLGWFYMEFEVGHDTPIIDRDQGNATLSRGELLALLDKTTAKEIHKMYIAMDMDPINAERGGIQ